MNSECQKQKRLQNFLNIYHFVELFTLIILLKKMFLLSSTNDDARVKTLEGVRLLEFLTLFSILTLAPSFVDEIINIFLAK